ncbi:hypothetical protein MUB49_17065 [Phaeobacter sp. J2-8]|nr:hypothetical protein [Phaeobacter sp. J2-8]
MFARIATKITQIHDIMAVKGEFIVADHEIFTRTGIKTCKNMEKPVFFDGCGQTSGWTLPRIATGVGNRWTHRV